MTSLPYRPSFVSLTAAHRSESAFTLHYQQPGIMKTPGGDLFIYISLDDNPTQSQTAFGGTESRFLRSSDGGLTWSAQADITGYAAVVWSLGTDMYAFTMNEEYGSVSIRKSTDDGVTWGATTLLLAEGPSLNWYHNMPGPLITGGRIYMPVFNTPDLSGFFCKNTRMHVLHAATTDDLLDSASWTLSNYAVVTGQTGEYGLWEPTAILDENDNPKIICRFGSNQWVLDKCVLVSITPGASASVAIDGLYDMMGGHSNFTVNRDPVSGDFVALVTRNTVGTGSGALLSQRTVLSVIRASSLAGPWTYVADLLRARDHENAHVYDKEGYQYTNWFFDGDDIVASIRTAEPRRSLNFHQANAVYFMRVKNYYQNLLRTVNNTGESPSSPYGPVTRNGVAI